MPTNDHQSTETGTPARTGDEVAARHRVHLEGLLRQRDRLSAIVAERVAYNLADSDDFIMELLDVEQAIEDRWPAVYEELACIKWLFADMARMHH